MKVHIFGGGSSPSCCNYTLRRTASDNEERYGKDVADTLRRNFYVDDMLKSTEHINEAKELVKKVTLMCAEGGFRLTKFVSNSPEIVEVVPKEDRKSVEEVSLEKEKEKMERALGVFWNVKHDKLGFQIDLKEKPETRRGILSTISSIYDPLGLAAPFLLEGKTILQSLCSSKLHWDTEVAVDIKEKWRQWKAGLVMLESISIDRCYHPKGFGKPQHTSLHHFSDASERGYGHCSYVRFVNEKGDIHCSLVAGKSRVAPLKQVSIPRLELVAATVAVRVAVMIRQELDIRVDEETFWTDSQVVLAYLKNDVKRFKTFVANRIQLIKDRSSR